MKDLLSGKSDTHLKVLKKLYFFFFSSHIQSSNETAVRQKWETAYTAALERKHTNNICQLTYWVKHKALFCYI